MLCLRVGLPGFVSFRASALPGSFPKAVSFPVAPVQMLSCPLQEYLPFPPSLLLYPQSLESCLKCVLGEYVVNAQVTILLQLTTGVSEEGLLIVPGKVAWLESGFT